MIVIITGPAGAGKSTIGKRLAREMNWVFVEGDDYHSPADKNAMAAGIPLSDENRIPWLNALRTRIEELLTAGEDAVVACSALKRSHRNKLRRDNEDIVFVRLAASTEELRRRLRRRQGHFAGVNLLESQLAAVEDDDALLMVDADRPIGEIVEELSAWIERASSR